MVISPWFPFRPSIPIHIPLPILSPHPLSPADHSPTEEEFCYDDGYFFPSWLLFLLPWKHQQQYWLSSLSMVEQPEGLFLWRRRTTLHSAVCVFMGIPSAVERRGTLIASTHNKTLQTLKPLQNKPFPYTYMLLFISISERYFTTLNFTTFFPAIERRHFMYCAILRFIQM